MIDREVEVYKFNDLIVWSEPFSGLKLKVAIARGTKILTTELSYEYLVELTFRLVSMLMLLPEWRRWELEMEVESLEEAKMFEEIEKLKREIEKLEKLEKEAHKVWDVMLFSHGTLLEIMSEGHDR